MSVTCRALLVSFVLSLSGAPVGLPGRGLASDQVLVVPAASPQADEPNPGSRDQPASSHSSGLSDALECLSSTDLVEEASARSSRLLDQVRQFERAWTRQPETRASEVQPEPLNLVLAQRIFGIDLMDEQAAQTERARLEAELASLSGGVAFRDLNGLCLTNPDGSLSVLPVDQTLVGRADVTAELEQALSHLRAAWRERTLWKLELLSWEPGRRLRMMGLAGEISSTLGLSSKSEELKQAVERVEASKKETDSAAAEAREAVQSATSRWERELAQAVEQTERFRSALASASIRWFQDLDSVVEKFSVLSEKLSLAETAAQSADDMTQAELVNHFRTVNKLWGAHIDDGYRVFKLFLDEEGVTEGLPPEPSDAVLERNPQESRLVYQSSREKALFEVTEFEATRLRKIEEGFDDFYLILERASATRSDLLRKLSDRGVLLEASEASFVADAFREMYSVPFRVVGSGFKKFLSLRQDLSSGLTGFLGVMGHVLFMLALVLLPVVAVFAGHRVQKRLERLRIWIVEAKPLSYRFSLRLAIWLKRLTPYSPWLVALLALGVLNDLLTESFFAELRHALPLVVYFVLYRCFRLLVRDTVRVVQDFTQIDVDEANRLVQSTSRIVGYFFLFAFSLRYLTEVAVEQGLIYLLLSFFMDSLGWILMAVAAWKWRLHLARAALRALPGSFGQWMARQCAGYFSIVFCLPTLFLLVGFVLWGHFWAWLGEFEFSKRLLATLYRKRVESFAVRASEQQGTELPENYAALFSPSAELSPSTEIESHPALFRKMCLEVDGWLCEGEENQSLALFGEKGVGKTVLVDRLARTYGKRGVECITLAVEPKITSATQLESWLRGKLGLGEAESLRAAILSLNRSRTTPLMVIVDDAHHLFLGTTGGFDGLRSFLDVINLVTDKIFWVTVFNVWAWSYLKGVMGASQWLRSALQVEDWSDHDIRQLIMKRHEQSGYALSFDEMAFAARSMLSANGDDRAEAQEQFFRLLWQQSNGNPKVAQFLWLNALRYDGQRSLKVVLPETARLQELLRLDDDTWFVLAALARHSVLSRSEVVSCTNLAPSQVAHALKWGLENRVIYRSADRRYTIHFSAQYDVIKQLKKKNFIYGNE